MRNLKAGRPGEIHECDLYLLIVVDPCVNTSILLGAEKSGITLLYIAKLSRRATFVSFSQD